MPAFSLLIAFVRHDVSMSMRGMTSWSRGTFDCETRTVASRNTYKEIKLALVASSIELVELEVVVILDITVL